MRRRRPRRSIAQNSGAFPFPRSTGLGRSGVRLLIIALVLLSLWLLAMFVGQVITSAQQDRGIANLQTEIASVETENQQLTTAVARVDSPAYAEQIGREQFGYARDGDTVLLPILSQATPTPASATPVPLPTPVPETNWHRWAQAFFPAEKTTTSNK
jgi:cell division protein FtsB